MKIHSIIGLCLSGSLLLAGQAALADNDKEKSNNRSARAVQVHIDKDTGQKIAEDDSDVNAATATSAPATTSEAVMGMPKESQLPVTHANGMTSVQLGQETLKYMTMTIGDDGDKTVGHETLEELKNKTVATPAERGLE